MVLDHTQAPTAGLFGGTNNTIAKIIAGINRLDEETLRKVCEAIGVDSTGSKKELMENITSLLPSWAR